MSETPETPGSDPPRDAATGRYVRRHGASDNPPADAPSTPAPPATESGGAQADSPSTPAPPATESGGAQADSPSTPAPPATESGGATPPPPPPAAPPGEEKDGRRRWMLLLLLLLILLALLCAGFAYMTWWRKDKPAAQPTSSPAATSTATGTTRPSPTVTTSPGTSPGTSPTATPPPVSSPSPSPARKTVSMPDVVGMPAADAKALLEGAGFTSIKFVTEANPNTELSILVSYTVTKQSVAAGTQVPVDTPIVITCKTTSNGKG